MPKCMIITGLLVAGLVLSPTTAAAAPAQEAQERVELPDLEPVAGASLNAVLVVPRTPMPPLRAQAAVDWQRDYDSATRQRRSGRKKMLIGIGANALGLVMVVAGGPEPLSPEEAADCITRLGPSTNAFEECADTSRTVQHLGTAAMLGGGGLFVWGAIDFWEGSSRMRALEASRSQLPSATFAISPTANQRLAVSVGARRSVSYHVRW